MKSVGEFNSIGWLVSGQYSVTWSNYVCKSIYITRIVWYSDFQPFQYYGPFVVVKSLLRPKTCTNKLI